jgi:FK506-binding nuclear protein
MYFISDAHTLRSRFEEVVDEEDKKEEGKAQEKAEEKKADSKKRPRETDATEADGEESKLSKAEKKKLKKLKAANGEAIPAGETKETEKPKTADKPKEKDGKKEKTKETKELTGGVKIQDHKVGTGRQAKNGDVVSMRYVGKLQNGKIFDSNTKGKPVSVGLCQPICITHMSS